jgi:hypothetical protein
MDKIETIEEFYQRKFDWIPDNIRNEIGHFNVFEHEPIEPGKTILPFCTHEGSGLGNSERDIRKVCRDAKVLPGLSIRGGSVGRADPEVKTWLKRLI